MPGVAERIDLARRTMIGLAQGSELPPKLGVRPRAASSHTGAMPALFRGSDPSGRDDLLGMKWVTVFPANRERGLDVISALVVLNDATTGEPLAVLDGRPITAHRTAAVSGVALSEWLSQGADIRVALVGAGVQGYAHVEVLAHVAPGSKLTIADRHPDRADQLAETARATTSFGDVGSTVDVEAACAQADVVLTMVSFGSRHQSVPSQAFGAAQLVVGVDYDMCVPASVARASSLFLTDDANQFAATRRGDTFANYPDPDATIGEVLLRRGPVRRPDGPVYVNHLGVGLADVVFADAIVRRADENGRGMALPR